MKLLALAIALVSCGLAAPQDQKQKMAEMLKNAQPGVHHKQLDGLAGTWTVTIRFKYGGGPERSKHVAIAKRIGF